MGKGSAGTKTTYTSSPEQQAIFGALLPLIQGMSQQGLSQVGQPNYGAPTAPTAPSMSGVLTGVPSYQIPNVNQMMPSTDWYNSISPEVKAGVWAPYEEGANMLGERMGAQGSLGNARGGYSGSAGAAFGDYYSKATNNAAMNLWGMSEPAMQAGWQAQLAQNQGQYNLGLTEAQTNYANTLNQQQQDYGTAKTAWGLPWSLTGMAPSSFSQGVTTQPSSGMGGPASALGGVGGAALGNFLMPGVGGLIGGGLLGSSLGGSLFGGK